MKVKAAIANKAGEPLEVASVDLEGPRAGEVLVEIRATGVCHTDAYTLSGADPEGLFPAILGHEGAGVVVEVGPGVTTLKSSVDSKMNLSCDLGRGRADPEGLVLLNTALGGSRIADMLVGDPLPRIC